MVYPLGIGELSTLRRRSHWHCDLFKVTRSGGGLPLLFTDSDRPQVYRGEVYTPTAGDRYDEETEGAAAVGSAQLVGALSPKTITSLDILRGVYDNARLDVYLFDWRNQKRYRHDLWYIDELTHDGRSWSATLTTSAKFLQRTVGDVYSSPCPAVLGDSRCGATVTKIDMTVATVTDDTLEFTQTTNTSLTTGWFRFGVVEWLTGSNVGTKQRVRASVQTGLFTLAFPTRFPIRVGDTFRATPGCDKLATTCKNKFGNLPNYRGNERQKNSKQLILSRGTA